MTIWLIEPRDPLIFRDGKPFTVSPGARAQTLSFPMPATIAGAMRTHAGRKASGDFDVHRISELMRNWVRGPLLVELDKENNIRDWLFPAPSDALLLKHDSDDKNRAHIVPLTVVGTPSDALSNLPDDLALVAPIEYANQKTHPKAPAFWRWEAYQAWLVEPKAQDAHLDVHGHPGPGRETRTRLGVNPDTYTAKDGALFVTSGLEFVHAPQEKEISYPKLDRVQTFGLVVETDALLQDGLDFLGRERRVAHWKSLPSQIPKCPAEVRRKIAKSKYCRLILATPAVFNQGYLPDTRKFSRSGVAVTVQALVNSRYQVVSGWDYEKNRPKPTRRLAPAGSVYFLKLDGSEDAIDHFIDEVWLQAVSDDEQARRDGFGLALLGVWDGVPRPLIYQEENAR